MSSNPHDIFIKTVLKRPGEAKNLFQAILEPDIKRILDLRTLALTDSSLIAEDQREFYSDLLFRCRTKSGSKANLYILFEHKSKGDKKTLLQMSNYMSAIYSSQDYRKGLEPVIGVVFLQGAGNIPENFADLYQANQSIQELVGAGYPTNFKVQVFRLQKTDLTKLKLKVTTRIILTLMKSIWNINFLKALRSLSPILRALQSEKQLEFFRICMQYIFKTGNRIYRNEIIKIFEEENMPKFKEKVITIADEIEQEGKEKGIKEGIQKGMLQGVKAGKLEDARRMKDEGLEMDMILRITGLSEEELRDAGI